MQAQDDPVGTLQVALAHAMRLLDRDPALAARQAEEILAVVPGQRDARLLLARANRALGDLDGALALLEALLKADPSSAATHHEYARALGAAGRGDEAVASLRCAVALLPDFPEAWRELGDHLTALGDAAGADAAYAQHIRTSTKDPRLMAAAAALASQRIAVAERLLREHLKEFPTDVAAIRMLAEVAMRLERHGDAELLLQRCLELAPGFHAARFQYAVVLHRENKLGESLAETARLLAAEPRNPAWRNLRAAVLARLGDYDEALALYAGVLADYANQPKVWMSYGHALKTAGRRAESVEAYRRSLALAPELGEAWWSLANLKTFAFEPPDLATMEAQLQREDLATEDRFHFHFALGKALEDAGRWEESFRHYERGNALRRGVSRYDPQDTREHVVRSKAFYTRALFESRAGQGCPAPDPIFVVGLPRSGSTLVEQILSSHSVVEGTMELSDLGMIARTLGGRKLRGDPTRYPEVLAGLDPAQLRALGEDYLVRTRIQRREGRPFFIDKMPNNFQHVGLIQLILPNAKIVDARRHPLACCFSAFKQHFARGSLFTYDLEHLGRYYHDYVELMAHFDAVLPGRVHRVVYERMIEDTEGEVRRLLDYCGLPFEAGCLRFFENERAVRTASSEQVRQPIYREGVDQWRHYEPWLGPLKVALGPVLDAYPAVPAFPAPGIGV